jgi:hypothetical protein
MGFSPGMADIPPPLLFRRGIERRGSAVAHLELLGTLEGLESAAGMTRHVCISYTRPKIMAGTKTRICITTKC